ncbi:hypothetical protein HYH02_009734 [Chlamydomonas schloesseri]|uniref:Serine protease n=1 Tax=Chlamydomonas schloesseri TaxID=2026947 RepID=A0A835TQJ4_9CHLO|nr:hypothetical protein HYH02_009734 [Chlamydomonas schloesseri]|eukprot:KAG2442250.1 hypothetical protein HYH02_009734 [Chlamydomonas schloesseri]
MDIPWTQYNMARLRLGLEASVYPANIVHVTELHDKQVFDTICPLLVKICAFSRAGAPAGEFSGFQYSTSSNLIVSAAHMVGFSGLPPGSAPRAEVFKARYADGFEEEVEVLNSAANQQPDIVILRGSRPAPCPLVGAHCNAGDTVYALGFSPHSTSPCFSKGIVSCSKIGSIAITAHTGNGYSGGPVVNIRGQLVGVIRGSLGAMVLQVDVTPAEHVHVLLLQSRQPGLG